MSLPLFFYSGTMTGFCFATLLVDTGGIYWGTINSCLLGLHLLLAGYSAYKLEEGIVVVGWISFIVSIIGLGFHGTPEWHRLAPYPALLTPVLTDLPLVVRYCYHRHQPEAVRVPLLI